MAGRSNRKRCARCFDKLGMSGLAGVEPTSLILSLSKDVSATP